jgi:hypothetical protein
VPSSAGAAKPPPPGAVPQALSRSGAAGEGITDVKEFLKDINPNRSSRPMGFTRDGLFDPRTVHTATPTALQPKDWQPLTRNTNCVNVVIATDAKLAGLKVPPPPPGIATDLQVIEHVYGHTFNKVQSKMSLKSHLQAWGPGSRAIVYGARDVNGGAHVFNAVNDGGVVKFLDGQTGAVVDFMAEKYLQLRILRTG